jgi:hypothetical protein
LPEAEKVPRESSVGQVPGSLGQIYLFAIDGINRSSAKWRK